MKIIHISKSDIKGGGARAAYRLHTGLKRIGVDSKMLVDNKTSDYQDIYGPTTKISKAWSKIRPKIDRLPLKFYNWNGTPFNIAWIGEDITKHELVQQADIVHLHWIVGGFLSVKNIAKLSKLSKPIVWTLHDMWAFTGGCHYAGECERYVDSCGSCTQLSSKNDYDITRRIWRRKRKAYKNLNLTIVTPSRWLAECAKKSSLFSKFKIEVIPNGLDTKIFKPIDRWVARDILNLPKDKKIILFESNYKLKMWNTFDYFKETIDRLGEMEFFNKNKLCLVIFGVSSIKGMEKFPFEVRFLGRLHDDFSLALTYSAADVFVTISLQDNLPNTVMESISCGTPVVGFNIGGIPDMITHKENGYLAEYKNPQSLAEGIKWILEDEEKTLRLRENARKKAVKEYSLEVQAKRYLELYKSLLY